MTIATVVLAIVAVLQYGHQQTTDDNHARELGKCEGEVKSLKAEVERLKSTIANQKKRLESSLHDYLDHYRSFVEKAYRAVQDYQAYDTLEQLQSLQKDLGDAKGKEAFERKALELYAEAKQKAKSLTGYVMRWRTQLDLIRPKMNGRIKDLNDDADTDSREDMFMGVTDLFDSLDSDADLLKQEIENLPTTPEQD